MGERVVVEIDAIVLDGVRPADRARVADAFTRELTRLLTAHDLPEADARRDEISALSALPAARSPRHLGRLLARSVHETLTAASSPPTAEPAP